MKRLLSILFIVLSISKISAQICTSPPTTQCYKIGISNVTTNSLKVSWVKGSGAYSLVVLKPASASTVLPTNTTGNNANASTVYGSGTTLGSSNYVVYKGSGTSVTITGLSPSVNYQAMVYSYDYYPGSPPFVPESFCIKTTLSSNNTENKYTLDTEPTTIPTISVTGTPGATTATLNVGGTGFDWDLVTVRNVSITGYAPVDGLSYSPATPVFGSGTEVGGIGTQNYAVYYSSPVGTINLTNLQPATSYYARAYALNGTGTTGNYSFNYYTNSYGLVQFSTLNAPPVMTAVSSLSVCQDVSSQTISLTGINDGSAGETQSVSIYAVSSNTALIQSVTTNYTAPNAVGSLIYTPTSGQYGSSTISVYLNDGGPNNSSSIYTFTITVLPRPSAAPTPVTSSSIICQQKNGVTFSVTPIANATGYNWSLPASSTITAGANTNVITVNFNTTLITGNIFVSGTNANGCGTGNSSVKTVNFDQIPTPANAGPNQDICTSTALLAGNTPSVGKAIWTLGSGSAIISTPTVAASSITGIANSATVTAVWTVTNGVCPASASTVTITNIFGSFSCTPNADFYTNNLTPCVNSPVVFYSNSVGATSYTWNFGPTAMPSTFTSASTTSVSVTYTTVGAKTVTLVISSAGGPDIETKSNYLNVISAPTTPTVISGVSSACQDETNVNYSTSSVANATSYNWSFASGIVQNTGSNTSAISVNISSTAVSGTIAVNAANACGTSGLFTKTITVNPLPTQATSISNTSVVCQGQNNVVYVANGLNNATSYVWTVPSGAGIISGTNTKTITVNYSLGASSGAVSVYGSNSCGDGAVKNKPINVKALPSPIDIITGSTINETCPLSTNINYSVVAVANATSYSWFYPAGYSVASGGTTNSIFLNASLNAQNGTIKVVGVNSCGIGDTSRTLIVNVNSLPAPQLCVVTVDSTSLYNEIIWQKNGVSNVDSFKVYRVQTASIDTLIGTVSADDLGRFVDFTANPNVTSYTYKLSALDLCGNEGPKSLAHQTIHLQTVVTGTIQATLDWNLYVGAPVDNYRVLRDTNNSGTWTTLINTLAPNVTSYSDFTIPPGTNTVRYRVDVLWVNTCDPSLKTMNTTYNTTKSNTKDFAVDGEPTNIKNVQEILNTISVYPNPTKDEFTINTQKSFANTEVQVINQLGAILKVKNSNYTNSTSIDMSDLASGVYFINIKTPIGTINKRIIKL